MTATLFGLTDQPIVVAPMGGGPSTPALAIDAAGAGALGFLAGGYKTADQLGGEPGAELRAVAVEPPLVDEPEAAGSAIDDTLLKLRQRRLALRRCRVRLWRTHHSHARAA